MSSLTIASMLFLVPFVMQAQNLRIQPDAALAEAAYRDAEEAWLHSDPNLERDLFKISPEEARRRIKRSAALRDEVMAKKQGYLDLLIQRTEQMRSRVTLSNSGMLPAEALKKDLEQQQSRILAEQDRLEQLIRELPPGDEYLLVRRPLEDERLRLLNLQNNIAQRIRSIETLDKAQQAIEGTSAGDALTEKLDSVLKLWQEERAANARQRSDWTAVYAAMEQAVASPPAAGGAAPAHAKNSPARMPKGKDKASASSPSALPTPAAAQSGGLAGVWTYVSRPDAWTGYGEPAMVTLELHDEGAVLRGSYTARLPVKRETHYVQLTVEGARSSTTSATLHWKSSKPAAEGEMELKLSPDGRLLVQRLRSGDSYIPLGSEVLLIK